MLYYVYILSTENNAVLYIGVTNNLPRRIYEHKNHLDPTGFTSRYNVHKLVYYEAVNDVGSAIAREKQLKSWNRKKKDALIDSENRERRDLYPEII